MKVVKKATIEIVKLKDLEVGDYILYSNLMCRIKKLPLDCLHPMDQHTKLRVQINDVDVEEGPGPDVSRLKVQQFPDDPKSTMHIGPFRTYYKIKDAELIDACISCGKEISEEWDDKDMCEKCRTEQIMGSSVNPENGEPWTEEEIRTELNMLRETEEGACRDMF